MRTINEAGLGLIKYFEGLRLVAYQDIAGVWTIGYGHTLNIIEGMVITENQATAYLVEDISNACNYVSAATGNTATDNEFAAMVDLCYNIGIGNFKSSSVLKFHKEKNISAVANSFLLWDKVHKDGELVVSRWQEARRHAERALYLQV
jgi:lysozyme